MPHEWNNMIVVTKEELIPDFFPSWEALKKKLARDKKKTYGIHRAREGKGQGNKVLIAYDTLPKDWRKQLGDPRKRIVPWNASFGRIWKPFPISVMYVRVNMVQLIRNGKRNTSLMPVY